MLGENRKTSEKKKQTNISSFFAPLPVKRSIQETPDLSKKLKYSSMIILDQEEPTRSSPIQPTLVVSTPLVSTSPTVSMKISSSPLVSSKISSTPITSTPSISKKAPKFTPSSTPLEKPSFKQKNEERYSWLLNVQDKQLRNQDDPLYDPSTLFIPPQSLRKLSDFERQFWEIKAAHFNQVVFFKKGKFYELYENDADIASREFGLKMVSRVNMRMAGVPESSFDNWAQQFVDKGYKVAKVDQMENSISKGIREKQTPITKDKCIQRALVSVLTKGTLIDSGLLKNDDANHTISIMEDAGRFCVWIVDASTSLFRVAVFEDDDGIIVETLVRQIKPIEVLGVRGSRFIEKVFKAINGTVEWRNANMVLGLEDVVDEIRFKKYFDGGLSFDSWPNVLQEYKDDKLVLQCFGVLLTYLQSLLIDSIIASGTFKKYDPIQSTDSLVLNGQTLSNLEIFESEVSGDGTLFKLINRCKTAMGKRMFKQWVCHPLFDVDRINERLDAVDFLFKETGLKSEIEAALKKLPDLERVVSRIRFGRCKVKDFVDALDAFREISDIFGNQEYIGLLGRLLSEPVSENITLALNFFQECFSDDQVDGENIQTNTGFDQVFDEADMKLKEIEQEIESERKSASREIGVQIVFKDMGKELFQMQVPVKTSVPQNWIQMSKTQKEVRYWSPKIKSLVATFQEAQEMREASLRTIKTRLFQKFDENFEDWKDLVYRIAEIDCIVGLSNVRSCLGSVSCRPEFVQGQGVFEAENLRHPCLVDGVTRDFIPNDVTIGKDGNIILLTGPNMAGKSTLLRQTCIAVILAQLGSYVPASKLTMTPFDRIFTRIGANDDILKGQSTFMVELSETSKILREATPRSLVILDELGRGTSTFDGYSIAYSVLFYLSTHTRCLGLFSTHYQKLTEEFENNPLIKMQYMNFICDDERNDITFLYKLVDGVCTQSHGMTVALMAGVPAEIIENANKIAQEFDGTQKWELDGKTNGKAIAIFAALKAEIAEWKKSGNLQEQAARVRMCLNSI